MNYWKSSNQHKIIHSFRWPKLISFRGTDASRRWHEISNELGNHREHLQSLYVYCFWIWHRATNHWKSANQHDITWLSQIAVVVTLRSSHLSHSVVSNPAKDFCQWVNLWAKRCDNNARTFTRARGAMYYEKRSELWTAANMSKTLSEGRKATLRPPVAYETPASLLVLWFNKVSQLGKPYSRCMHNIVTDIQWRYSRHLACSMGRKRSIQELPTCQCQMLTSQRSQHLSATSMATWKRNTLSAKFTVLKIEWRFAY